MASFEKSEHSSENPDLKKKIRELLIIAVLGAGGSILQDSPPPIEEKIEKIPDDLGVLSEKFDIEWKSLGQRYIVHIGQFHGQHNLNDIEAAPRTKAAVIEAQKAIEEALLYLRKTHGVEDVYVEGVTPDIEKMFAEDDAAVDRLSKDLEAKKFVVVGQTIMQWTNGYYKRLAEGDFPRDEGKALFSYFLLCRLNDFFTAYEATPQPERLPEALLQALSSARANFKNDRLIAGENIWVWGAAEKLRSEHIFRVRAAENKEVVDKTEAMTREMYKKDEEGVLKEADTAPVIQLQNQREDIALDAALQGAVKDSKKFIAIIYGNAHDFSGNLRRMHEQGKAQGFGFVKLNNKVKLEWEKIKKEELPEYNPPSLEDRR